MPSNCRRAIHRCPPVIIDGEQLAETPKPNRLRDDTHGTRTARRIWMAGHDGATLVVQYDWSVRSKLLARYPDNARGNVA